MSDKTIFASKLNARSLEAIRQVERVVRWQWLAWNIRWNCLDIRVVNVDAYRGYFNNRVRKTYVTGSANASRLRRLFDSRKTIYVDAIITEGLETAADLPRPHLRVHSHIFKGEKVVPPEGSKRHRWWEMTYGEHPLGRSTTW